MRPQQWTSSCSFPRIRDVVATYRILYWQEIPSQIKAEDEREEVNVNLPPRFMERIDQLAAKRGLQGADDYLGLMTPVIKGVLTDKGFENAVNAQQVFGGHGYIEEWGMSQFVRDARIAQIYEGANGIQAMDLVGRKLGKDGGRALMAFLNEVGAYLKERAGSDEMNVYLKPLGQSLAHLQEASMWFMQNAMAKPDNAGAGATDYLHLFGLVALGYMWCRIAEAALAKLPKANGSAPRYSAKLVTARFFVERMLPETATRLARIKAGAASTMEMPDEQF